MLLSGQITALAEEIRAEARQRPYIRAIIPTLADDKNFWCLMLAMLEIVVNRWGYEIVERADIGRSEAWNERGPIYGTFDTTHLRRRARRPHPSRTA